MSLFKRLDTGMEGGVAQEIQFSTYQIYGRYIAIADKVNNIESTLNGRIVKIEQVVERITKGSKEIDSNFVTNVFKGKEPATAKLENLTTDNNERDPFLVPGLQSTWNPDRGQFKAPEKSPGPRTKTNLLCLSEPNWLWKYWCELVGKCDLDKTTLDTRNSSKPIRPNLKPLSETHDIENLMHLQEIQSALVQEGTCYHLWPQRVCHLFQGDFKQVNCFCKTHRPTWPMTIEAVLQILSLSNNLRSPVNAFVAFRSGPSSNESTAEFLKRFEQAFHRMPTRERGDMEVAYAIEYTLQTHAGMVWSTLIQQGDAFLLHNALSIAWTVAEKQQNWMAQLSSRPMDRQFLPTFKDPLRDIKDSSIISQTPTFYNPINSVNAANAQTFCYSC
ncbi:hypothetical protein EPUL_004458, partial [Erysiphe pulchra]